MASRETEQKKKHGFISLVLKLLLAAASVYLLFTFVSGQLQISAKRQELNDLTVQVEQQVEKNAELKRLMEGGDEDAYVERMARVKLGYARPEEEVFVDITGE